MAEMSRSTGEVSGSVLNLDVGLAVESFMRFTPNVR